MRRGARDHPSTVSVKIAIGKSRGATARGEEGRDLHVSAQEAGVATMQEESVQGVVRDREMLAYAPCMAEWTDEETNYRDGRDGCRYSAYIHIQVYMDMDVCMQTRLSLGWPAQGLCCDRSAVFWAEGGAKKRKQREAEALADVESEKRKGGL